MFLPLGRPRGSSGDLCGPFFADLWGPLWTSSLPQQADKRTHQGRGSADFLAILVPPWTGTPVHFARMSHAKPQLLSLAHINTSILERMSHAKTRFPHETQKGACLSDVSHKNLTFEPPSVLFCDCAVLWRRLWGPLADLSGTIVTHKYLIVHHRPFIGSERELRTLSLAFFMHPKLDLRASAGLPHRARC